MIQFPQINLDGAKTFAKDWKFNNIICPLNDAALHFAVDFTNAILKELTLLQYRQNLSQMEAQVKSMHEALSESVKPQSIITNI
jgi:hypothetical protein